jgi:hypothetical protein
MKLVQVARDETMTVSGYEDHTFECPACHETDRRRVFRNDSVPPPAEPPASIAPSPPETSSTEAPTAESSPVETSPTVPGPAEASPPEPMPFAAAPPISEAPARSSEDDAEGEELLRRAIAMVRGPIGGSQPIKGLTDEPQTPAKLAASMRSKNSTGRVVQIRHDPSYDAAYAAKDTRSGLVVLRHQDSTRLREMCDRLGWEVLEDGAAGT